jgi:lysyl-tRNA synthetase class 2
MEVPLKACLQYHKRVFEIGQCFRFDLPDNTHYPEFLMMELYASDLDINDIKQIMKDIVIETHKNSSTISFNEISIKNFLKCKFNISIDKLNDDELKEEIIKIDHLSKDNDCRVYEVFKTFIEKYLDYSTGFVFLQDYHKCTNSTAKKQENSHLIKRFEFFINGVEIANAYEDEEDLIDMKQRCEKVGLFNYEEKEICRLIKNKIIFANSVGLGIGIERLCMSSVNKHNISELILSKNFNFLNNETDK